MALEGALAALMAETVTVEPFVSVSLDGTPTYGAPVSYRARIEATNKKVFSSSRTDPQAVERVATGRIYLPPTPVIRETDRITLPDGRQPRILAVEAASDERGPHHQVVLT